MAVDITTINLDWFVEQAKIDTAPIYAKMIAQWSRDIRKLKTFKSRIKLTPMPQEYENILAQYFYFLAYRGIKDVESEIIKQNEAIELFEVTVGRGGDIISDRNRVVEILSQRIPVLKKTADELKDFFKQQAFWVARIETLNATLVAKEFLKQAAAKGLALSDFMTDFPKKLKSYGFSTTLSHIETVYRTNFQQTYNISRWEQMGRARVPAVQYLAITDERLDEICRPYHLMVYRLNDPIWRVIKPTQHHKCRCTITPVTTEALKRGFIKLTPRRLRPPKSVTDQIAPGFKASPLTFKENLVLLKRVFKEKQAKLNKLKVIQN